MRMKVPPTTVIRFANLPSLGFPGKNKVRYFLDGPRTLELYSLMEVQQFSMAIFEAPDDDHLSRNM
jgi:hypothetical protein